MTVHLLPGYKSNCNQTPLLEIHQSLTSAGIAVATYQLPNNEKQWLLCHLAHLLDGKNPRMKIARGDTIVAVSFATFLAQHLAHLFHKIQQDLRRIILIGGAREYIQELPEHIRNAIPAFYWNTAQFHSAIRDICEWKIYHGTNDIIVPPKYCTRLAEGLSTIPTWIEGGGHFNSDTSAEKIALLTEHILKDACEE